MPETTNPNRINPVTVANAAENQRLASVVQPLASPTGTPILPPSVAPWAAIIVAVAALLPLIPGFPPVAATVCGIVVALGAAVGIASPGARKA